MFSLKLHLLACHRVKQPHSIIYREEQLESWQEEGDKKSLEMRAEARELVDLSFFLATKNVYCSRTQQSPWKSICKNLAIWTAYSTPNHVLCFLQWMFSNLAVADIIDEESVDIYRPGGECMEITFQRRNVSEFVYPCYWWLL